MDKLFADSETTKLEIITGELELLQLENEILHGTITSLHEKLNVAGELADAAHDMVYTEKIYHGSGPDKCGIIGHPHSPAFFGEFLRLKNALITWEEMNHDN